MPVVHALLLNWNSFELNAACIASLKESRLAFQRIIVVDNGSTDGSLERLKQKYTDEQLIFLGSKVNCGFAGGMNIGIKHACSLGFDFLLLINNDTIIDPDCVRLLVMALDENPHAGMAGPSVLYFGNPEKIWQSGGYFSAIRAGIVVPGKGKNIREIGTRISEVGFLTGCAFLVRKSTVDQVGLLDTSYFIYNEDLDYSLRCIQAGWSLLFVPSAKLWHKIEDVAKDRTSPRVLYLLARSSILVLRKRFRLPYRWYGILVQLLVYTPYRFFQIVKGGSGFASFRSWLEGIMSGLSANTLAPLERIGSLEPSAGNQDKVTPHT